MKYREHNLSVLSKAIAAVLFYMIVSLVTPLTIYADERDDLLGTWVGTFTVNNREHGLEILIYMVESNYRATAFYFSDPLTRTDVIAHYSGHVQFNADINRFEVVYTHSYFRPSGWTSSATFRGIVSGDIFSGEFTDGGTGTGLLTRVASAEDTLAVTPLPTGESYNAVDGVTESPLATQTTQITPFGRQVAEDFLLSQYPNIFLANLERIHYYIGAGDSLQLIDGNLFDRDGILIPNAPVIQTPDGDWAVVTGFYLHDFNFDGIPEIIVLYHMDVQHHRSGFVRIYGFINNRYRSEDFFVGRFNHFFRLSEGVVFIHRDIDGYICCCDSEEYVIDVQTFTPIDIIFTNRLEENDWDVLWDNQIFPLTDLQDEIAASITQRLRDDAPTPTNGEWADAATGNDLISDILSEVATRVANIPPTIWLSLVFAMVVVVVGVTTFKKIKRGKRFVCPYCVTECYSGEVKAKNLHCPSCERAIPKPILDTENLLFCIIGVAGSGKSAYITVMLNELKKSSGLNLSLGHMDRDTLAHQNANYKSLYEDRIPVPATAVGNPMPQLWAIKNLDKKTKNNVATYSFTIFDGAGEHTQMIDVESPVARYINMSEAIIFVLDPLTISSVRSEGLVDEEVVRKSLGGNDEVSFAEDIVNDIANYIRAMNSKRYGTSTSIEIPVAVVMTKFDTVWNHPSFGENALVKNPSLTVIDGKIKAEEIDEVHSEIEDWLEAIGERGLPRALQANFPNHKYFGVSSYGQPPKDIGVLNKPDPHRVLDPVLWLFKNKEFID